MITTPHTITLQMKQLALAVMFAAAGLLAGFSTAALAETGPDLTGTTAETPNAIDQAPFEYEDLEQLRDAGTRYGKRISVCAGQSLPGWAIKNVTTNFTTCGGGWDNIWHLIELNGAKSGQRVTVCTRSPVPPGWIVVGYTTNYTMCGRNASRNNLKTLLFP